MAAAAMTVGRPIRIEAIAGPAIDMARLVDGVKAQKPVATRPYARTKCPCEDVIAGQKPNARARDWSVATTACGSASAQRQSHPSNRSKTAKGTNPKSDAG